MRQLSKHLLLAAVAAAASVAGAYDLNTRALPPIRLETPPAGNAMKFVDRGELKFAVVADYEGEAKGPGKSYCAIPSAVNIITNAFAKTTGVCPEVFQAKDAAKAEAKYDYLILVGNQPKTRELGIDVLSLPDLGFRIATFEKGIAVVGKDTKFIPRWNERPLDHLGMSQATYYGAIDFVERFLGVRYYFIGDLGKIYPKCADLVVEPCAYEDAPYFRTRGNNFGFYHPVSTDRKIAPYQKYSNVPLKKGDTSMFSLWRLGGVRPPHGKHHPDPEALQRALKDRAVYEKYFYRTPSGKLMMNEGNHIGNYFDPINLDGFAKDFIDAAVKKLDSQGKEDPWKLGALVNNSYVNFGVCDTFLELRDYRDDPVVKELGLLQPEDLDPALGERARMRNIYGRFYKYMGERLLKEAPGVKLFCMNYYNSLCAPTDPRWKLPPNVESMVCDGSILAWAHSPKVLANSRRLWGGWQDALQGRPNAMGYLYDCGEPVAKPIVVQNMGDAVKALGGRLGRDGIFFDCGVNYRIFFAYYVAAHAQWNPDCDKVAMTEEAFDLCCGREAGAYLKEFYARLRKIVTETFDIPRAYKVKMTTSDMDLLERLLAKARESVEPGSDEARRLDLMVSYWPDVFARERVIASYRNPEYTIPKVADGAVQLDGAADEPFWAKAPEMKFMCDWDGKPPFVPTRAKLAWGEKGVYGWFETDEKAFEKPGGDMWSNDTLEFFVSQGTGAEAYHQFAFDALGRSMTLRKRQLPIPQPVDDQFKDTGFAFKTKCGEGRWSAEFFVPFACLWNPDVPKAGDKWQMNFVKTRVSGPVQLDSTGLTQNNNARMRQYPFITFGE